MADHKPDEFLMKQITSQLKAGPLSIAKLSEKLMRHPKNVRQAISDLMFYGKVAQSMDGYRYELASGGYSPDGGEAA